ncbi:MAG: hypothetical protein H6742_05345 [Alphaproteobacteria bacterium]|nr:hypothetical protein [Alphaproteobacteria bacterium]
MSTDERSARAAAEVARINAFFPIMPVLGNRWARTRPFEGRTIGISAHLTTLTAALVRELVLGGGKWVVVGASEATTDQGVVNLLRDFGVEVCAPGSRDEPYDLVLEHEPDMLADVGGELIARAVAQPEAAARVKAAVEVTKTGVTRLQELDLPFGVVNINDGRLKPWIENRHGVGEGLWHAVQTLTGMHLSGRRVGVIGYGPVGRGVAAYARAAGANVQVVEKHPIRRLYAHYDGYPAPSLEQLLSQVGIVVTCCGSKRVVGAEQLGRATDGLVMVNAGHGNDEIDVRGIKAAAGGVDHVADHVVRYRLEDGPTVVLLADGHPLNIVMNSGSPEPVLLHFAVLGLTLEWLTRTTLPAGENPVPVAIEEEAAGLALQALGMGHG